MNIDDALQHILALIKQDSFGGRDAPTVTVTKETCIDSNGVLHGELQVHIAKRDNSVVLLHQQSLDGIADERELKDVFADALSKVLAEHSKWPR